LLPPHTPPFYFYIFSFILLYNNFVQKYAKFDSYNNFRKWFH
jgi:hypothetical protein